MHKALWAISSKPREKEMGRYGRGFCKPQPANTVFRALPLGELKLLSHPEDQWRSFEDLSQLNITPSPSLSP